MRAGTRGWLWDPAPAEDGPLQMPELWRAGTIVPGGQRTKGEARGKRTAGWGWVQAAAQTARPPGRHLQELHQPQCPGDRRGRTVPMQPWARGQASLG